jgi:hypothetical protein
VEKTTRAALASMLQKITDARGETIDLLMEACALPHTAASTRSENKAAFLQHWESIIERIKVLESKFDNLGCTVSALRTQCPQHPPPPAQLVPCCPYGLRYPERHPPLRPGDGFRDRASQPRTYWRSPRGG